MPRKQYLCNQERFVYRTRPESISAANDIMDCIFVCSLGIEKEKRRNHFSYTVLENNLFFISNTPYLMLCYHIECKIANIYFNRAEGLQIVHFQMRERGS